MSASPRRTVLYVVLWLVLAAGCFLLHKWIPAYTTPSGLSLWELGALLAAILGLAEIFTLVTCAYLALHKKPVAECLMIGKIYRLASVLTLIGCIVYGFGELKSLGTSVAALGGMFLGWSLQAPVSGLAAWVLVSLKRPFRPGDRIQFPSLALVGDVKDVGAMYTVLDQVGGSIGSEEPVGRYVLVPNAMLFSQVVINYTVRQEAAFMLDEVVVRITYDSDWAVAEKILVEAASEVTADIIKATQVQPYIRSDWYDYGVYLRLRYQTSVKDRTGIASEINKRIFTRFQQTEKVDLAIPFIYSYRTGEDMKDAELPHDKDARRVKTVDISSIDVPPGPFDEKEITQLSESIAAKGLMQPIVVMPTNGGDQYHILIGDKRFEACRRLGWKNIPAVVQSGEPANRN